MSDLASAAPESFQQEMGDGLTLETLLGTESPEESLIEQLSPFARRSTCCRSGSA